MPSNAYLAEFTPDRTLRKLVFASGVVIGLIGVAVITTLPFAATARVVVLIAWSALALWQLGHLLNAWSECRGLRLAPGGEVAVRGPDGAWRAATLASGGILLRKHAWIRLRMPSGRIMAEPLRGDCRRSQDWRRLHVIWRHVGAPA